MAAVGNGRCVCTGCGAWSLFIVCSLFHGHCGHLCSQAWLFVVVVCLDGGGKGKSNHVMLPNKHCLLSMTNK